jgi:hypothetical protein
MTTSIEALEYEIKVLKNEVRTLKDIEALRTLQKAYGYYLEHWMSQEIIDLFSDGPNVSLTLGAGTYSGKAGVKRYFNNINPTNEFMHQIMQMADVIEVEPSGERAFGRWYGFGAVALPSDKGVRQSFFSGIYSCEYVKENGVWKFETLRFDEFYSATPKDGWVKPERLAVHDPSVKSKCIPDIPRTVQSRYPAGYIVPFHFKHPVTGKPTSEALRNAALPKQ